MYKKTFGGQILRGTPLTLRYVKSEEGLSRIGFILRKKAGNACLRNSIRRTLRCSFQAAMPQIPEGTWLVFDVSDQVKQCRRSELRSAADRLLGAMSQALAKA